MAASRRCSRVSRPARDAKRERERGAERGPKGAANVVEAFILYLRDEVALRNIGHGGERFVDEEDVFALIEPLMARIVRETQGIEVPAPFRRMTYEDMLSRYGSDKPDLRYGMELADLGEVFAATGFRAFASALDQRCFDALKAVVANGLPQKRLVRIGWS